MGSSRIKKEKNGKEEENPLKKPKCFGAGEGAIRAVNVRNLEEVLAIDWRLRSQHWGQ